MLDSLLAPIDPTRLHSLTWIVSWHGRSMILAWGMFLPLGVLIARFCKITPAQDWPHELDNHTWWHWHLVLQITGGILMLFGLLLILNRPTHNEAALSTHAILGWVVFSMGTLQILSGLLRGSKGGPTSPARDGTLHGDHYDMTRYRKAFEYYHKFVGYGLLLLSVFTVMTGMWHANAPVWMWLGLVAWWCCLLLVFGYAQHKGFAVDTYRAIWGPDQEHPGNRIKPIGFGLSKPREK